MYARARYMADSSSHTTLLGKAESLEQGSSSSGEVVVRESIPPIYSRGPQCSMPIKQNARLFQNLSLSYQTKDNTYKTLG